MNTAAINRLLRVLPALRLTNAAPLDISGLPVAQQDAAHRAFVAARSRLDAAAQLREAGRDLPAILLYREGIVMLGRVLIAARGQASDEMPSDGGQTLERFASLLANEHTSLAADLRDAMRLAEPQELDALPGRALASRVDVLASLTARLLERIEPTSRERSLYVKYAPAASVLVTLLCAFGTVAYFAFLPTNIAKGRPVVASSATYETKPGGVVDGKDYGRFGFHSDVEASPWIRVDLGRKYHLTEIKIFGRHDCCYDQSVPMLCEVSGDGEQFDEVATKSEPFEQIEPWVVSPNGVSARYLRVRTLRESVLVLSEIEVYGEPAN